MTKNSNIVYTSETPYSVIGRDFIARNSGNAPLHTLEEIDRRWRKIGKLAEQGLLGMKYI
jgi:hypothetical protein